MRILHVIAQYPDSTGSGIYCRQLIRELAKNKGDQQALLFARNPEQEAPDFPASSLRLFPLLFDSPELPFPVCGMSDIMPYRSTVYSGMTAAMLEQWKAAFRSLLARALREFRPDLILCHHLFLLARLCLESGLPVLAFCHATDLRQAGQHPAFYRREVGALTDLRAVVALTRGQVPEIVRLCQVPEAKILLGGGAYDERFFFPPQTRKQRQAGEALHFLYAGKIAAAKGCFEMLEAFHRLPEEFCIKLDLVGRTGPAEAARCRDILCGDPRVRFFPPESQAELGEHMRRSDAFLFPSYYEGIGLIALEALASGLHLLCTDLPGLREFLGTKIWRHPCLSVVSMPPLEHLDHIRPSAREAHVRNLEAAMRELAVRLRSGPAADLSAELKAFSWPSLATKIRRWAEEKG